MHAFIPGTLSAAPAQVRKSLERISHETSTSGKPAFHLFSGVADVANKSQKLHPWRRIFQDLFITDLYG